MKYIKLIYWHGFTIYNIKGNQQIFFAWKCHNISVCMVAVLNFSGFFSVNVAECSSSSAYMLLFWISLFISGTLSLRDSCWMRHGIKRIPPTPASPPPQISSPLWRKHTFSEPTDQLLKQGLFWCFFLFQWKYLVVTGLFWGGYSSF